MRLLGDAEFGALALVGVEDKRTCANGLPIAPASVRMLGRFAKLVALNHPNLCKYIELVRCRSAINTVILVSEYYKRSIVDEMKCGSLTEQKIASVAYQLADAMLYLHKQNIVIGHVDIDHLLVLPTDNQDITVRLSNYGINRVTANGRDVNSFVGCPYTMSPELLADPDDITFTYKSDTWAFGIILLQLAVGHTFSTFWSPRQYINVLLSAALKDGKDSSIMVSLLGAIQNSRKLKVPVNRKCPLLELASRCLMRSPSLRPQMHEVIRMITDELNPQLITREEDESWEIIKDSRLLVAPDWPLRDIPIDEAFFLWKLSGTSVETLLTSNDIIPLQHPITTIPVVVVGEFRLFGNSEARQFRAKGDVFMLPSRNFKEKLLSINKDLLLHSVELDGANFEDNKLSIVVKEKDVFYQRARMELVRHLVSAFSIKKDVFLKLITSDIPPMTRAAVWTALLGVSDIDNRDFLWLDTVSPHSADRQLDVDIPRCHQYEEMMTSPAAHVRLKRLLKAWLRANPDFVYWQGLDSLAAPFLLLHFNNLPYALACMNSFINKYLKNFFLKENSVVIQEYLAVFNHLVAYVDAELYMSMKAMDFFPELFAIPWFLTCFAHVLPLHKLFHVWDSLLLGDASFPLCVGLAVLHQMRTRLTEGSFNDTILLFSDLPDLSMERVIEYSIYFYSIIPPSCAYRAQGSDKVKTIDSNPNDPRTFTHSMTEMTYAQLKQYDCPRISKEELAFRVEKQTVLVIDLRNQHEFNRGSIVRSINYINVEDTSLSHIKNVLDGAQGNKHPICVLDGGKMALAYKFASFLISTNINGVCVLDGGFDGFRNYQCLLKAD